MKIMNNKLLFIYDKLFKRYGNLKWWPANTPYEVIVGAVLTQNTAWANVEKAISNFGNNLSPEFIINIKHDDLIDIIRPSGFFNQKAVYLKSITEWFGRYNYNVVTVKNEPVHKLRSELLATKGIGKETADSILLYAFDIPSFVVDAYTVRLCERFSIDINKNYNDLKHFFESNLPAEANLYNNYHALIVINGKNHCKKKPHCTGCPLEDYCMKKHIGKNVK
jgi:endonuclease-3 related protein